MLMNRGIGKPHQKAVVEENHMDPIDLTEDGYTNWTYQAPPPGVQLKLMRPEWTKYVVNSRERMHPEANVSGLYWKIAEELEFPQEFVTGVSRFSGGYNQQTVERILRSAFEYLAEHPVVPTPEQIKELQEKRPALCDLMASGTARGVVEWQRMMFRKRELRIPEEVSHLTNCCHKGGSIACEDVVKFVVEAFETGKKSGNK